MGDEPCGYGTRTHSHMGDEPCGYGTRTHTHTHTLLPYVTYSSFLKYLCTSSVIFPYLGRWGRGGGRERRGGRGGEGEEGEEGREERRGAIIYTHMYTCTCRYMYK